MKQSSPLRSPLALLLSIYTLGVAGCGTVVIGYDPSATNQGGASSTPNTAANCAAGTATPRDKVDLLLVVDDSGSMATSQATLAAQLDALVGQFINPRCVDAQGVALAIQPSSAREACAAGSKREFAPVVDLHVGVISSSLGGHGADSCKDVDDRAHLLNRGKPTIYDGFDFMAWDPGQRMSPPGSSDATQFVAQLSSIVMAVGESGCGFESTLESWYRFLIDPDPYATIRNPGSSDSATTSLEKAVVEGTDEALLAQRKAFLRPDSAIVIVMLSDEDDCSIRDDAQHYVVAQGRVNGNPFHMPPAREECAENPNSSCCLSCGQPALDGCSDSCFANELPAQDDHINLRCFDQKRRFGIDFLWPTERYIEGLTAAQITDRHGDLKPNPLFAGGRTACDVHLAGIVGVPWQDVARRDYAGLPDLDGGLDESGRSVGGFQSAREMAKLGTWDLILGDPSRGVAPTDPLMLESVEARSGTNPITGGDLRPASADYFANGINGHEHADPSELQYACIFPLVVPKNCDSNPNSCVCEEPAHTKPICQLADDRYTTTQHFGKATPAPRHLAVLKGLGEQGIVGSLCSNGASPSGANNFGLRPSLQHIASTVGRRSLLK